MGAYCVDSSYWGFPKPIDPAFVRFNQKAFAARLGVDPGTLARWERGEREPKGSYVELVESILR